MRGKRPDDATIKRVLELTGEATVRDGINRFLSQTEIGLRVGLCQKTVANIQRSARGGSGSVQSTTSPEKPSL